MSEDCPGRSEVKCHRCGKCHNMFTVCSCADSVVDTIAPRVIISPLEKLYDELGTFQWVGGDKGWDLAIEAVRKHIAGKLK